MDATIHKSADGYTLRIVANRVDIIRAGHVLSTMRWDAWSEIHAALKMDAGGVISAGQLGIYC